MLNSPALPKPYLNGQEAADILRISIRTLERMCVEGTGPRYLKAGAGTRSRVLYRPADLDGWSGVKGCKRVACGIAQQRRPSRVKCVGWRTNSARPLHTRQRTSPGHRDGVPLPSGKRGFGIAEKAASLAHN
ncbi:MAG: helix-turn-helix domain-containing protein [Hyphomicrobiaceae bacterium]